jgi:HEAT repeats
MKLIVRLFLVPLLIAGAVIGIMVPIGWMSGGPSGIDTAISDLRRPGGQRTGSWLVGPGAKQRYIDATTIFQHLRDDNLDDAGKIRLTGQLVDVLDHYTAAGEGDVQPVLLLALGQVWVRKPDPIKPGAFLYEENSATASAAREQAITTLLKFANAPELATRKAALLALAYWKGRDEAQPAVPVLLAKLQKDPELDVKISAVTALGQIASPDDQAVINALNEAMRDSDPHDAELVWNAAIALAQLGRPEAQGVLMRLLDRKELDAMQYYDRETDPKNPTMQPLSEQEKERILINAMLAAQRYNDPAVQAAIKRLSTADPSERVKQGALEILGKQSRAGH